MTHTTRSGVYCSGGSICSKRQFVNLKLINVPLLLLLPLHTHSQLSKHFAGARTNSYYVKSYVSVCARPIIADNVCFGVSSRIVLRTFDS
jgi:hypothetical protein